MSLRQERFQQRVLKVRQTLLTEDIEAWKAHPVTKLLLEWLAAEQEIMTENWTNGNFVSDDFGNSLQLNAEALGRSRTLEYVQNVVSEINTQLLEEEEDLNDS